MELEHHFEKIAGKLFKEARVPIEGHENQFREAVETLHKLMDKLSRAQAIGQIDWEERVNLFNAQKRVIVDDLMRGEE